jgi:hypothetical protein
MRLSMPPPGRFKRALSSGKLDCDAKGRKILTFKDENVLELPVNRLEDEVVSDGDKDNMEMVEDLIERNFDLPLIEKTHPSNEFESSAKTGDETMVESFVSPVADGYSLDFIQKNRTGDNFRKNFLSKLTYQKVWLSPMQ